MIFVVLGTQKFQFNRLLKQIDLLIESGIISESVFAQTGHSNYEPKNFEYRDFLGQTQFDHLVAECSLLITHSGIGTIVSGLKFNKKIIVCPRLRKYGEHVDDHQEEISQDFSAAGYVLSCIDMNCLSTDIEKSRRFNFTTYHSGTNRILEIIEQYIFGE